MPQRMSAALCLLFLMAATPAWSDPPVASYIFPAGAQRGTDVEIRVGGLNLHHRCHFEILGPGVTADSTLAETSTVWFDGPIIPLPDSQQAEDYPRDHAGRVKVEADAPVGSRARRVWTAQGATPALPFIVGDLPEIVEREVNGDPVPTPVNLPLTINGRIFPREDVDLWTFPARKGEVVTAEVHAARLGVPLDARIEIRDRRGRRLAENDDAIGSDPLLQFVAPEDGTYEIKIQDANVRGGQSLVYRLTLTNTPYVTSVYPLGGRRGMESRFELFGEGLPERSVSILPPQGGPSKYPCRLKLGNATTNPFFLALDDLPEALEAEPNDSREAAPAIALPVVANGRIDKPGDVNLWAVRLRKGTNPELEVLSRQLESPLVAVLSVLDAAGKELARAEGQNQAHPDPSIRFAVPSDGTYYVQVAERFRSVGGPRHAYRLRMREAVVPDFRLRLTADALTLPRGGQAGLKVEVERSGVTPTPVTVEVEGLPPGVTAAPITIAANQAAAEVTVKCEKAAPVRAARLTVRGTAQIGGKTVVRTAALRGAHDGLEVDSVLMAVALPTPFQIKADADFRWASRGTVRHRHFKIARGGFAGPIEVRLADRQARHLQGVTGPTLTVAAGVNEFDYPVNLPPWMETGRTSRTVVMATATIRDTDGTEHEVSFTPRGTDEQIIAVVEPGRLAIEAARGSISAARGQTVAIPVRVSRSKSLAGAVKLELVVPPQLKGVAADPVTIPADHNEAIVTIVVAEAPVAVNQDLTIRGTVVDGKDPVIAEARVAIRAQRVED